MANALPYPNEKDGRWMIRVQRAGQHFEFIVLFPPPSPLRKQRTDSPYAYLRLDRRHCDKP